MTAQQPGQPDEQPDSPSGGGAGEPSWSKTEEKKPSLLREVGIILISALVLSAIVRTFVVQAFYVPTGSMENTLLVGDRILVWKPGGGAPERGQIVVFKDPADWLPDPLPQTGVRASITKVLVFVGLVPDPNSDALVKRVIGVGGDTVECCDPTGRIKVNGQPIDEAYIKQGSPTNQVEFKVTVPQGRAFVMGDNRGDSADSRFHLTENEGTVANDDVIGPVKVIMWPPGRWGIPD